jgi:hypothetical protein
MLFVARCLKVSIVGLKCHGEAQKLRKVTVASPRGSVFAIVDTVLFSPSPIRVPGLACLLLACCINLIY